MKKKFWIIGVLIALLLVIVGCASEQKKSQETSIKQPEKKDIQELTVTTSNELATLDSALYSDVISSDAIGQIFEGLYRIDQDNNAELGMAESEPSVNDAKTVYTFKLKEAKWSNGEDVKASDFVYAFQKVVDPATASPSANQMDIFKNGALIRVGEKELSDLGVKALDTKTIELTLENPIPYLAKMLTGTPFFPQNEILAKKLGEKYGTNSSNIVGNGPFELTDWSGTNLNWTYQKNQTYWDQKNVQLKKINVEVAKETSTGANLFDGDQVDYTGLTDEFIQKYQGANSYHEQPKALIGYLGFNTTRKVTGNVHVRRALALAFDKKAYTESILIDGSKPMDGFIPSDFAKNPASNEDFRKENGSLMSYDVKKAQNEWKLAQAELGDTDLTLEILSSDTGSAKKTVEFLQAQYETNLPGLKIKLKNVPLKNRLDLNRSGDFDVFFGTWTPDYQDPINFLEIYQSNGGINFSNYHNNVYDEGINEIKGELATKPQERWTKMMQLEKQLIEQDAPIALIYQGAQAYLLSSKVKQLQVLPFGRTVSYRLTFVQ